MKTVSFDNPQCVTELTNQNHLGKRSVALHHYICIHIPIYYKLYYYTLIKGLLLMILLLTMLAIVTHSRVLNHHFEKKRPTPIEIPIQVIHGKSYIELPVNNQGKVAKFLMDLTATITAYKCKTQQSVPAKALAILNNPFRQKYEYQCPLNTNRLIIQYTNQNVVAIPIKVIQDKTSGLGILGLGKNSDFFLNLPKNQKIFSIWGLHSQGKGKGRASIGGYNPSLISGDLVTVYSVQKDIGWNIWVDGFSIGQTLFRGNSAIVNFNQPKLGIPEDLFSHLLQSFSQSLNCRLNGLVIRCSCENFSIKEFTPLLFKLAGRDFMIPAQDYIAYDDSICNLMIEPTKDSFVLGSPFFRNHMVIFSQNGIQVSNLTSLVLSQNKITLSNVLSGLAILFACVLGTVVLIEIVRRCSGLASVKEETIHDIIIRQGGNLN